jgi:hypothetical protein
VVCIDSIKTGYDAALIGALTDVNFGAFPREQGQARRTTAGRNLSSRKLIPLKAL